MKRTPLRRVGRRALTKRARRAEVVAFVRHRDIECQFLHHLYERYTWKATPPPFDFPLEHGGPLDVHEIIPRSVWPDGELEPSNCVLVCRIHHIWIDANPLDAHRIKLHGMSWENP